MLKEQIKSLLDRQAGTYSGQIGEQKFGVDSGPFEKSKCKYVAYLKGNYSGDFYFDTVDEFCEGFIVNGMSIGEQLESITKFVPILCDA